METILQSPLFGISITLFFYFIGGVIYNKIKSPLFSPFVLGLIFIITFLIVFKIPTEYYNNGGSIIQMMLAPATCSLAISIYNKLKVIKQNFVPIIISTFAGSLASIITIIILCKLFNVDSLILNSMLPKSVTNAIAIDLTTQRNGIVAITITSVVITGIFGAIFSPILIKILKLKNPISIGLAIGTSSHGVGTAKAIEIGETEGALSGIAMGLAGIMTVLIMLFI